MRNVVRNAANIALAAATIGAFIPSGVPLKAATRKAEPPAQMLCVPTFDEPPFFGPSNFRLSPQQLNLRNLVLANGSEPGSLRDLFAGKSFLIVMPVLGVDCPRSPEGAGQLLHFASEIRHFKPDVDLSFAFIVKGETEDLRKYSPALRKGLVSASDKSGRTAEILRIAAAGGICLLDKNGDVLLSISKYGQTPFDVITDHLQRNGVLPSSFELKERYAPPSQACPFFSTKKSNPHPK